MKQKTRKARTKQVAAKSLRRGQISKKGRAQRKLAGAKRTRTSGKARGRASSRR